MSTTKIFLPAGIKIGSTYLGHVGQQSAQQNLEDLTITPSGDWAPNQTGSKSWAPEFSLETFDLASLLDLCILNAICADLTAGNVDLHHRAVDNAGMADAVGDSTHLVYRLQENALLVWERISLAQGDECKITFKVVPYYNGTNAILVPVPSQTIDAAALQNSPFTLGPLEIITDGASDSLVITGLNSLTINLNPEVVKQSQDGNASPGFVYVKSVRPVIEFETTDCQVIHDNIDDDGEGLDRVTVWFRCRRPNKINYPDATALHARIRADTGVTAGTVGTIKWTEVSGDPAVVKGQIALHKCGVGDLFTWTKNVAIATGGTTTTTTTTTTT